MAVKGISIYARRNGSTHQALYGGRIPFDMMVLTDKGTKRRPQILVVDEADVDRAITAMEQENRWLKNLVSRLSASVARSVSHKK